MEFWWEMPNLVVSSKERTHRSSFWGKIWAFSSTQLEFSQLTALGAAGLGSGTLMVLVSLTALGSGDTDGFRVADGFGVRDH